MLTKQTCLTAPLGGVKLLEASHIIASGTVVNFSMGSVPS